MICQEGIKRYVQLDDYDPVLLPGSILLSDCFHITYACALVRLRHYAISLVRKIYQGKPEQFLCNPDAMYI